MKRHLTLGALLAFAAFTIGCEGDPGPAGPPGPEGPQGPPGDPAEETVFTFQGDFGSPCIHCHTGLVGDYVTTNHRFAYDDLGDSQSQNYCIQCHTTGFNCAVDYATDEIDFDSCEYPEAGYSYWLGVDTELGAERRADLEGVQCESCHGPMGPDFNAHVPEISFATHDDPVTGESLSLCYKCHGTQIEEWKTSPHALAVGGDLEALNEEFNRSSCDYCHSSEGFIRVNDPAYATYEFGEEISFIGCPTCHDPHVGEAGGGNYAQLRTIGAVELSYVDPADPEGATVVEGYGPGQTCMQCHKARRDYANVQGQLDRGSSHFGPHSSPQTDMFAGAGSYEIPGYTYNRTHAHQSFGSLADNACVTCHMVRETFLHGETQEHAFHTFEPDVGNCAECHGEIPDFDVGGVQTQIQTKLDSVAVLLGYADAADAEANLDEDNAGWERWQREVLYAFTFVANSGSLGVHNPPYANSLLDNAIDYANANLP